MNEIREAFSSSRFIRVLLSVLGIYRIRDSLVDDVALSKMRT